MRYEDHGIGPGLSADTTDAAHGDGAAGTGRTAACDAANRRATASRSGCSACASSGAPRRSTGSVVFARRVRRIAVRPRSAVSVFPATATAGGSAATAAAARATGATAAGAIATATTAAGAAATAGWHCRGSGRETHRRSGIPAFGRCHRSRKTEAGPGPGHFARPRSCCRCCDWRDCRPLKGQPQHAAMN